MKRTSNVPFYPLSLAFIPTRKIEQLASRIPRIFLRGTRTAKMPSPAISRLDAAKSASNLTSSSPPTGGVLASANITTSTNPDENAVAGAANQVALDPKLATAPASTVTSAASVIEGAKQLAAYTAVDQHVLPHHKVRPQLL